MFERISRGEPLPIDEHFNRRLEARLDESQASGHYTNATKKQFDAIERETLQLVRKRKSSLQNASRRPAPAARRDFIIHYAYIAEHAGLDVSKRFRESVEATYAALAKMPGWERHSRFATANMPECESGESANSKTT